MFGRGTNSPPLTLKDGFVVLIAKTRSRLSSSGVKLPVMPRKPQDEDATKKLRPEDETQVAPKGTKIGKLRRSAVLGDFRRVAKPKR